MKTIQCLFISLFVFCGKITAQDKIKELTLKTSTICEMCKETIEKKLIFEKGVKQVNVDYQQKLIFVKYRDDKTNPDKIKLAVSKLGYRADDIPADKKAFKKLPECCKKEGCGTD
jgi:copper chaperone CopZ